jgi:hypothetical protein
MVGGFELILDVFGWIDNGFVVDRLSVRNLDIDGGLCKVILCDGSSLTFMLHIDIIGCNGVRSGVDIGLDVRDVLMTTFGVAGLLEILDLGSTFSL